MSRSLSSLLTLRTTVLSLGVGLGGSVAAEFEGVARCGTCAVGGLLFGRGCGSTQTAVAMELIYLLEQRLGYVVSASLRMIRASFFNGSGSRRHLRHFHSVSDGRSMTGGLRQKVCMPLRQREQQIILRAVFALRQTRHLMGGNICEVWSESGDGGVDGGCKGSSGAGSGADADADADGLLLLLLLLLLVSCASGGAARCWRERRVRIWEGCGGVGRRSALRSAAVARRVACRGRFFGALDSLGRSSM